MDEKEQFEKIISFCRGNKIPESIISLLENIKDSPYLLDFIKPWKYEKQRWETDRLENETAPVFAKRVYGHWMREDKTGITLSDIGENDPELRDKIRNSMRWNPLPDDIYIPTREEKAFVRAKSDFRSDSIYQTVARTYENIMRAASRRGTTLNR